MTAIQALRLAETCLCKFTPDLRAPKAEVDAALVACRVALAGIGAASIKAEVQESQTVEIRLTCIGLGWSGRQAELTFDLPSIPNGLKVAGTGSSAQGDPLKEATLTLRDVFKLPTVAREFMSLEMARIETVTKTAIIAESHTDILK